MYESINRWRINVAEALNEPEPEEHVRHRPRKSHRPVKEEKGLHAGRVTRPTHAQPDNRTLVPYRGPTSPALADTCPNPYEVAQASCARTEERQRDGAQQQQHAPAPPPAHNLTNMSAPNAPCVNHPPGHGFPQYLPQDPTQNPPHHLPQNLQHHLPQTQQHVTHFSYSSYRMHFGRNGEYQQIQIDYRMNPDSVTFQYTSSSRSHSGTEHQGNLNMGFGDRPGNVTLNVAGCPPLHLPLTQHSSFRNPPLLPPFNPPQRPPQQLPSLAPPNPSLNPFQDSPQNPPRDPLQNLPPPPSSPHPSIENRPSRTPFEASPRIQQRQPEPQPLSAPEFPPPRRSRSQTKERERHREERHRERGHIEKRKRQKHRHSNK